VMRTVRSEPVFALIAVSLSKQATCGRRPGKGALPHLVAMCRFARNKFRYGRDENDEGGQSEHLVRRAPKDRLFE